MSALQQPRDLVAADLGEEIAGSYDDAVLLTKRGSEEGAGERGREAAEALDKATEVIVDALKSVPDNKLQSAGYAELLIAYGKALLVHVRREMLTQNVLTADVENEINTTSNKGPSKFIDVAEGALDDEVEIVADKDEDKEEKADEGKGNDDTGVDLRMGSTSDGKTQEPADDSAAGGEEVKGSSDSTGGGTTQNGGHQGEPGAAEGEETEKKDGKGTHAAESGASMHAAEANFASDGAAVPDDADSEEEDISTAELFWEQLEYARVIIENLGKGYESRISVVHEIQGDFLSESDGGDIRAADEYRRAAEAATAAEGLASRRVADLYHRRYLALRKDEPVESIAAMERAIDAFKSFVDTGKGDSEDAETLSLMRQDLSVFRDSLGSALTTVIGFGNKDKVDVLASSGVGTAGAGDEITAVPREIIPVTVKPKRRAVPVAVAKAEPIRVEGVSNSADPTHADEPREKRRKVSGDNAEGD